MHHTQGEGGPAHLPPSDPLLPSAPAPHTPAPPFPPAGMHHTQGEGGPAHVEGADTSKMADDTNAAIELAKTEGQVKHEKGGGIRGGQGGAGGRR